MDEQYSVTVAPFRVEGRPQREVEQKFRKPTPTNKPVHG
jgi:hypothetical protein